MTYRINLKIGTLGTQRYKGGIFHHMLDISVDDPGAVSKEYFESIAWDMFKGKREIKGFMDSLLKAYGVNNIYVVKVESFCRVLQEGETISGGLNSKEKDKIEKLLNLSMSSNEHEASTAMAMAVRLMKKHSITEADLDAQEIIAVDVAPKTKMFAIWEVDLFSSIGAISGCYVVYLNKRKDDCQNKIMINGYERDALNAQYVGECYRREIEKAAKKASKELGLSKTERTDYINGLVQGVKAKLSKDHKDFFNTKKETGIVPVDTRVSDVKNFIGGKKARVQKTKIRAGEYLEKGMEDAEKIHISKATTGESSGVLRIGAGR